MSGRPTKYNELTLEVTENYLRNFESYGDVFPSKVGLALVLGVHRDTIHDWATHPEKAAFSDILERIHQTQHQVLINKGLNGEFNSNIAKLVLGKHGYKNKAEVDQNITIHERTIDDLE